MFLCVMMVYLGGGLGGICLKTINGIEVESIPRSIKGEMSEKDWKEADIISVQGNPITNIDVLWNVQDVISGGHIVDRGSEEVTKATRQPRPA